MLCMRHLNTIGLHLKAVKTYIHTCKSLSQQPSSQVLRHNFIFLAQNSANHTVESDSHGRLRFYMRCDSGCTGRMTLDDDL